MGGGEFNAVTDETRARDGDLGECGAGRGWAGDYRGKVDAGSARPLNWWSEYHHVLGHNIGFAIAVTVLAAIFAERKFVTAALVFISFHLHLVGDLIGARGPDGDQWPIPYWLPFSNRWQWTWSGQWALNAWPNFLITGALIAAALVLAWRRGFSPMEMFSRRMDARIVAALRNRFPVRAEI